MKREKKVIKEKGGEGVKGDEGDKGATQAVILSQTPPTSPSPSAGDLWWDTDDADLHIYYDGYWIAITNSAVKGDKGLKGDKGNNKGQKPRYKWNRWFWCRTSDGPAGADGNDGQIGSQWVLGPPVPAGADGNNGSDGSDGTPVHQNSR